MNGTAKEKQELTMDELEKASAGSWLGNLWNKIKSFASWSDGTAGDENR